MPLTRILLGWACWLGGVTAALAQPVGFATLTEGKVALTRGAALYTAADGIRVQEGDILATGARSQTQIQLAGGTLLGIGPETELMLGKADSEVALLRGWLKVTQKKGAKAFRLWTPAAQATLSEATVVARAGTGFLQAFVESGTLAAARTAKAGEFIAYKGSESAVAPRPAADFVQAMPKHFLDPLPEMPDKLKERRVEPRRERDVAYEDVADWLKSPAPARRGFVRRFHGRIGDARFRAALDAHMRDHMEWDRVLHPEKYEEKQKEGAKK